MNIYLQMKAFAVAPNFETLLEASSVFTDGDIGSQLYVSCDQ